MAWRTYGGRGSATDNLIRWFDHKHKLAAMQGCTWRAGPGEVVPCSQNLLPVLLNLYSSTPMIRTTPSPLCLYSTYVARGKLLL